MHRDGQLGATLEDLHIGNSEESLVEHLSPASYDHEMNDKSVVV